mmetsp:Transcript_61849/g.108325  ORF Transcript_61849/g.108325 Transcript_61849/m.108325 type:complete len:80 (-) Transcript_61849:367-606(-)
MGGVLAVQRQLGLLVIQLNNQLQSLRRCAGQEILESKAPLSKLLGPCLRLLLQKAGGALSDLQLGHAPPRARLQEVRDE